MPRLLTALLPLAFALAACNGPPAPQEAGVCWRAHQDVGGKVSFAPLARDVGTLENCAVLLEAVRLQGQAQVNGAYQGYFLFIGADAMTSALHTGGVRYPIFQPPQRRSIDRDIRRLLAERGGKMPDPGDFRLERQ
ncbi:MAG TPA: hypothetical protein VN814_03370 [Caulobacteraceae bacterium]|nr:hypothetical protein [Caulobacteraceae bacterium]